MIIAYRFRVLHDEDKANGPWDVVEVPPRPYLIYRGDEEPDRQGRVPSDQDAYETVHQCNLCSATVVEPGFDAIGEGWTSDFTDRPRAGADALNGWWPWRQCDRRYPEDLWDLRESFGALELCSSCYAERGTPESWDPGMNDVLYGPEERPYRWPDRLPDDPAVS